MQNNTIYSIISGIYDILDLTYFKRNSPRKAMLKLIEDKNINVLDICTGTGANAVVVAKNRKNAKITGVDLSPKMLEIAANKIKQNGLDNINIIECNAANTELPTNYYDVIIISLVLHEINDKTASEILKEASRLLKKDGKLIVIEWEIPKSILQKILFLPIMLLEPESFRKFIKKDKKQYFKKHGFSLKRIIHSNYSCIFYLKKSEQENYYEKII